MKFTHFCFNFPFIFITLLLHILPEKDSPFSLPLSLPWHNLFCLFLLCTIFHTCYSLFLVFLLLTISFTLSFNFSLFSFFSFHSKVVFKVSIPLGQQVYMQLTYTLKTCPCILSEWDGWYMIIKLLSQRIVCRWANFENVFWLLVCQPWKWQNN